MTKNNRFTVLEGGRDKDATVNAVSLKVVPDSLNPLPVDVRVFEEDAHLVLTIDPVMRYTEEHPLRLMTRVLEAKPNRPGSIVINNTSWYAVVHDLDEEPTCRAEWVSQAYVTALALAEKKRVQKFGLPLLGCVHGNILPAESLSLLLKAIKSNSFHHLKEIIILVLQHRVNDTKLLLQNTL